MWSIVTTTTSAHRAFTTAERIAAQAKLKTDVQLNLNAHSVNSLCLLAGWHAIEWNSLPDLDFSRMLSATRCGAEG
jgi:hypothetical protein